MKLGHWMLLAALAAGAAAWVSAEQSTPPTSQPAAGRAGGMGCPCCPMCMSAMKGADTTHVPLIGEDAPAFTAETSMGKINFPADYHGKWVILFSHPADFTPVCTTEFMTFATLMPKFNELNCELIGLSIDSTYSHIAWLRTIKDKMQFKNMRDVDVRFPVIADTKMDVARKYGMIQPTADDTKAVRAVFFIDPQAKIRALIYYPLSNGRNFQEILRLLIAMQTADAHKVSTPADWQPGDDVIVPPPGSCGAAADRVAEAKDGGLQCLDWFLCLKKMPKDQLKLPQ